jgi:phosphoglycerol transferase MdoB-like AlkP superfamily enzyme
MKKTLSLKDYIHNQLYPLCIRLGFLVLLYSFFRSLFFVVNTDSFSKTNFSLFLYGIRFDLSAIFYCNLIYIIAVLLPFSFCFHKIYRKIFDGYFIVINGFAALVSYIDTAYYPYVLKRMTCDFFSYIQIGFDFRSLLPSFLKQYWYLLLLFLVTLFIIVYVVRFTNKRIDKTPVFQNFRWKDFIYKSAIFIFTVVVSFVGMRGGFQTRPIGLIDSGKYASIQNAAFISNTPFSLIKSFGDQYEIEKQYFPDLETAEQYYSPIINSIYPCSQDCYPAKNVVIIILEGFSQYLIKGMSYHSDSIRGYAPFLDSLLHQSISFNGIANGHRTIDALQAIFAGVPKLLEMSTDETHFSDNFISTPVEALKKHGYNTLFFHGAKNGSMNIESFCYSIGFDAYFGKNEYPNPADYDGVWGISDRSFLKFTAQKLNTVQQPFLASILTLSSHNPFTLPKDADGLDIQSGTRPIHALASYTDHALRAFFETVSHSAWFNNTLFIITGDHVGEGSMPGANSVYVTLQIPIFFYHPKANNPKNMGTMQQLDIMPSLFSYLNINEPLFSYGNNIFDSTYTVYSANYTWGVYQLVTEDFILQFDGEKSIGLYDVKKDILMQKNLIDDLPDIAALYEQKLKAILQSYTTRLVKNQLFINK